MKKIFYESVEACPDLQKAYDFATKRAFDKTGDRLGVRYDAGTYGNQVSTKGTLVGESACSGEDGCGKRIRVTFTLPRIKATDENGKEVKLFDTLAGKETIQVSGHKCSRLE